MSRIEPESRNHSRVTDSPKALHIIIHGRVQGVFFRSSLKAECDKLEVKGWVRNQPDGSVEAMIQGSEEDLDKVIDWCSKGPERAEVTRVETHPVNFQNPCKNFESVY